MNMYHANVACVGLLVVPSARCAEDGDPWEEVRVSLLLAGTEVFAGHVESTHVEKLHHGESEAGRSVR